MKTKDKDLMINPLTKDSKSSTLFVFNTQALRTSLKAPILNVVLILETEKQIDPEQLLTLPKVILS